MKWKIGNVEIKNQVVLAPMAGISNTAYRQIIKEMGAGLIFAEMVSDKALVYGSEKTFDLLKMSDMERPIAQQIFGSDVDSFVKAAKLVEDKMHPDIIDINMGCPVPKVAIKSQAGSALLKNPAKIKEIVSAVVKAVSVPVTVKIRSGWDANSVNAVEVAKVIEEAGASAITVHGRTRAQGYSGNADWNIIKQVKEMVNIPVIGNGDVTSAEKAKEMLDFIPVEYKQKLYASAMCAVRCQSASYTAVFPVKSSPLTSTTQIIVLSLVITAGIPTLGGCQHHTCGQNPSADFQPIFHFLTIHYFIPNREHTLLAFLALRLGCFVL